MGELTWKQFARGYLGEATFEDMEEAFTTSQEDLPVKTGVYEAKGWWRSLWDGQWDAWVDKMIRAEDNAEPEVEDWVVTEDGPQWREG